MQEPPVQLDYASRPPRPRRHATSAFQDALTYIRYIAFALAAVLIVASFCVVGYLIWGL
jgi:hypothetical protein